MLENTLYTANYYQNIGKLLRFLTKYPGGYVFASAEDQRLIPEITQTLLNRAKDMGTDVVHLSLKADADIPLLGQIQEAADKGGIIVSGLGSWIRQGGHEFIQHFNFSREGLQALDVPIVFWIPKSQLSIIANKASDIFSQRALSTVHFQQLVSSFNDELPAQHFTDSIPDSEKAKALEFRIELLKQQLLEAEKANYPVNKRLRELVIPLLEAYIEYELPQDAQELIDQYPSNWPNDAQKYLIQGQIFEKLGEWHAAYTSYQEVIKVYEQKKEKVSYIDWKGIYWHLIDLSHQMNLFEDEKGYLEKVEVELLKDKEETNDKKYELTRLYHQWGRYFETVGNLAKALEYFEDETDLFEELYDAYPQNVGFKNGLAISYSKLGETHSSLGNLAKALEYFEQYNRLEEELYDAYPQNVGFKNGLAISYIKLGSLFDKQKNQSKAREFYGKARGLWEELVAAFPAYAEFGRNLAIVNKMLKKK